MLEAILWDNDGVLVNTEALYYEACRRTLANEGTELSREMYVRISMTEGRSVFDLIDLDRDERARLRSDRDKVYMGLLSSRDLTLPGVRETLEGLDGRLRMSVVTSSHRAPFDLIHSSTGLMRFFESALVREDFTLSTPDPEPYLKGLELLGLDASSCLAIEDSARGLASARAAGLKCIVVPNTLTQDGDFSEAYAVLDDIRDVIPAVEKLLV